MLGISLRVVNSLPSKLLDFEPNDAMNYINQQKHHGEFNTRFNSKVGKFLHVSLSFQLYHDHHLKSLESGKPVKIYWVGIEGNAGM